MQTKKLDKVTPTPKWQSNSSISHYDYIRWYFRQDIKFLMLPYLQNREFALLVPPHLDYDERTTRFFKVNNVQNFDRVFDLVNIKRKQTFYNLYSSVATYFNGLPFIKFGHSERKPAIESWMKKHQHQMSSYDFFIDIDAKPDTFKYAKDSALLLVNFFKLINFPFILRFSGTGFHFITPFEYFEEFAFIKNNQSFFRQKDYFNVYRLMHDLAETLHNKYTELIDLCIYDSQRLVKIPYSLAIYEGRIEVCRPINHIDDLENLELGRSIYPFLAKDKGYYRDHSEVLHNAGGKVSNLLHHERHNPVIKEWINRLDKRK